jgi:2',3'-cyclic-nucleotide 2'-phosphodiesterase (5'-nucleotidase family)
MTGADIPAGDFTYETAHTVLQDADPARRQLRLGRRRQLDSASTLVTLEVTGGRIIQSLENCLEDSLAKGFASSYPYASGLRYSVDATASFNQRLVSPVVFKKDVWGPLESDEDYTIITTKEWAEEYFQSQGQATDLTSFNALTEFAQQEKVLNAPEFSTREFVKGEEDPEENNNVGGDGERAIATVQDNICLDWVPGQGLSNVCSKEETATQGGGVGNLVAWGLLSQLETYGEDTEMFLFKGSDCQTDLVQGEFKEKDAQALLPFNHKLSVLSLTGEQLIMALEGAIDYVLESAGNEGSYPYAGGLRFSVNPFESFGKRVSDSEWFTRGRWKSINMAVTYRIGTTLPLAEGDDGYTSLDDAIGRVDTDYLIRDVFIDHATTVGTLENPPLERYSTQDYLQTPS